MQIYSCFCLSTHLKTIYYLLHKAVYTKYTKPLTLWVYDYDIINRIRSRWSLRRWTFQNTNIPLWSHKCWIDLIRYLNHRGFNTTIGLWVVYPPLKRHASSFDHCTVKFLELYQFEPVGNNSNKPTFCCLWQKGKPQPFLSVPSLNSIDGFRWFVERYFGVRLPQFSRKQGNERWLLKQYSNLTYCVSANWKENWWSYNHSNLLVSRSNSTLSNIANKSDILECLANDHRYGKLEFLRSFRRQSIFSDKR